MDAQRSQHTHPSDPQHHLLCQAHFPVASVEPCRQIPVGGCIGVYIGVHQIQGHPPYLNKPHFGKYRTAGQLHFYHNLAFIPIESRQGWHFSKVDLLVHGFLVPVAGDLLMEVTLWVQTADSDEWQSQVTGLLAVITREDAQAARVDGQCLVQSEFCRKIGNRTYVVVGVDTVEPGVTAGHIGVEVSHNTVILAQEPRIPCHSCQRRLTHFAQEVNRVMVDLLPQDRVYGAKQILHLGVPGPPQVVGEFREPAQSWRHGCEARCNANDIQDGFSL